MWQRLSQLQPKTASQMITLTQLMPQVGEATLHELLTRDEIIVLGDDDLSPEEIIRQEKLLFTRAGWTHMLDRVETLLGAYHRRNPLRLGMPRTELASRLHLDIAVFNPIVAQAIREGHIAETSTGSLRLPEYEIQLSETQQKRVNTLLEAFHAEPYTPPSTATAEEVVGPELLASLLEQRVLIQVSPDVLFSAETYDEMVDEIQRYLKEHETVTLAQVRDLFDTSRKYATALLEHLDERRITRRVGDERILRTT
jgi:selenocysteine-specific elongation factor